MSSSLSSSETCKICSKSNNDSLYYDLIAQIKEENDNINNKGYAEGKVKTAHIECCSKEQIKQILLSQTEDQIRFYKDIANILERDEKVKEDNQNFQYKEDEVLLKKLNDFEQKYGSFDEIRQGITIDHNLLAAAFIAELKRKISTS